MGRGLTPAIPRRENIGKKGIEAFHKPEKMQQTRLQVDTPKPHIKK
jgi:hypothetical protein